ncbi:MAG TPA: universal stress protein [Ktedonobacterales bacterium]
MFTRILLPLDGAARAEEALPFARELALADGAEIFLLHVEAPSAPSPAKAAIEQRLEALASDLRAGGVVARVLSLEGQTPATIAAVTEAQKIDLIALAPQSRNLLETLWRPSVTAGVLAKAAVPIFIAPPTHGETPARLLESSVAQVIVPLDGSPLAEKALPVARRIAERYSRGLLLLRVIPPLQVVAAGPGTYPLLRDEADLEVKESREYLSVMHDTLQQTGHVPVQYMLEHGIPAEEILRLVETKPGSMVVMSTHGRGGLARFMLGSVALAVARKINIPLLIIPADHTHGHARATAPALAQTPAGGK